MPELEQELTALAGALEWPATPDLASRLYLPARVQTSYPRWALAAAAAIVIALAALAVYPPSREAIASWVNLHTSLRQVQQLPTPSPQPPGPLGSRLGLGGRVTLPEAQKRIEWRVAIPSTLGQPDEVYLQPAPYAPAQGEVTLVYATRPDIPVAGQTGVSVLVTEARGSVDQNFFGKMIGPGTTLEAVTVAGHQGYWIAGPLNEFFFTDSNGLGRADTVRLAANTLILDDGGTIVRIEGNLTKAQALEIASSLG